MTISTRTLVGREEELASLASLLDEPPAVAAIGGDAGIGKSELWLAALDAASARGYLVLSSRPTETEARFSFSGLADLLGGVVDRIVPGLPDPQQRALEAALALTDPDGPVQEGVLAFAFLNAVRTLAAGGPVVVAVDDVQWLDAPSLDLLAYGLERLRGEPVVALLTVRGEAPSWLRRHRGLLELELSPLSIGATHLLLRDRLGESFARPVLLRIWETSVGNPFFALELGRALLRRGGRIEPGAELPVSETLEGLVYERLATLSAGAEHACRVVAASSEPTVGLVEAVAEGGAAGLEEAVHARVLQLDGERVRFTHPLLASAVASSTVGERKRLLHRRLAELVEDPEERARHLSLAASGPDEAVAEALDAAARRARRRGAGGAAAELAERALQLTPAGDAAARRRRRLEAADLEFETGDVQRAQVMLEEARDDAPPGPERAAALLRLGRLRAETSGADAAVSLFREALAQTADDRRLEAAVLLELGQFLRFTEGAEGALAHLDAAVRAADQAGDDELTCRTLGAYGLIHFNSGRGVAGAAMERALALEASLAGRAAQAATPFFVHQLVWSGELARARERLDRWSAWATAAGSPEAGDASWYRALLEWRAGEWDLAAAAAADAVSVVEQYGREVATITGWPGAVVAAHRGDADRARELALGGLAQPGCPDVAVAGFEWVLGFLELSSGDHRAALGHLERADGIVSALGILEPAMQWHVPDLLDALLAAGDLERAELLAAPWEERARTLDRSWALAVAARLRALLRAHRGDPAGAAAGFEEALAEHERAGDPFQRARTLLALGATERRAKRRRAARETLGRALEAFEALPAPLWAEKARAELARIGGRTPSRGELTEAERRIAELVAEGRSNREVASALFLTEHTVETALTRIYRKVGVRSRTALAHHLGSKS